MLLIYCNFFRRITIYFGPYGFNYKLLNLNISSGNNLVYFAEIISLNDLWLHELDH